MRKKTDSVIFAMLLCAVVQVAAQEKKHLTLDEAVALGIQNSKSLKIDQAKIDQSIADYTEARNRILPDLKISGSALALANANVDLKIAAGGNGNSPKANSAFYGSANASLPIFAGGKINYGIQSAKYLLEATRLNTENDRIAVAYNIAQAYNNLFKAGQTIRVLEENLKAAQQRDAQFLKLENNGIIARNDRLKANLQTSDIELQLLDARNSYSIANVNMDLLLGLPESTEIELDTAYTAEKNDLHDAAYFVSRALENRKDFQALALQRKAAELGTKAAKAEDLPTIALTGGYVAADIPKILSVYNAANIGIGVQYNMANLWKKNSSLMKAKAREEELSATDALVTDQIKLDIKRDYQNAQLALKRIEILEKSVQQADENYRITRNKYDNGLATMTELLDADAAQMAAHIKVSTAKADAALAHRKLLQTAGILSVQ